MAPVQDFCIAKGTNLVIWFCNITPRDSGFRKVQGKIDFLMKMTPQLIEVTRENHVFDKIMYQKYELV